MKKNFFIAFVVIVLVVSSLVYANTEVSREIVDEKVYTIEKIKKYGNWPFNDNIYGIAVNEIYPDVVDGWRIAPKYFEISTEVMEVIEGADEVCLVRIVEEVQTKCGFTREEIRFILYLKEPIGYFYP